MSAPLTALTDRDLMLNLYVSVVMAIELTNTDPEACQQQILKADADWSVTDHMATLDQILAEVERRLGIDSTEIESSEEALH